MADVILYTEPHYLASIPNIIEKIKKSHEGFQPWNEELIKDIEEYRKKKTIRND